MDILIVWTGKKGTTLAIADFMQSNLRLMR